MFHVAIENFAHDMNIGSVVRSANAFLAAEVHIVGNRRWNRRGAMVTERYQHVRHHDSIEALVAWASEAGIPLIGIDNVEGSVPIETYDIPRECVLVFGQEGPGLSAQAQEACVDLLAITRMVARLWLQQVQPFGRQRPAWPRPAPCSIRSDA